MKRLMIVLCVAAVVGLASSAMASIGVSLVPDSSNVAPGSTVNVSVNMSDSPGFIMTAMSEIIFYDPAVFTYVDPVVQGAFLHDDWSGGLPLGAAATPGELRVAAIDWTDFNGELLAAGNGTLFTFTLLVNANATLGPSDLSWGDASGGSGVDGFDYGDETGYDVVLSSVGASINVGNIPEAASIIIWSLLGTLAICVGWWRKRIAT
jgi:hypothetical protein